jgi:hypothetical protein
MPIHDVGYRPWKGQLTAHWSRWWNITEIGIRTAFSSRWIRRMVLASWFPVIYFGIMFFVFERMVESSGRQLWEELGASGELEMIIPGAEGEEELAGMLEQAGEQWDYEVRKKAVTRNPMIQQLPNGAALVRAIESGDQSTFRHTVWGYLLCTFLRYSQGLVTLMIVGLIVPPLISRDVRSRAFLLYYSRPITRMEYLLGKIAIPGCVLMMVTLAPALVLYFVGLMLSPNLLVTMDTWDLPIRIVLATAAGVIPTCLIGLLFSSLTQESRFAGFAWFTIWGLGAVVWMGIYLPNSEWGQTPFDSNWSLISIYSTIGRVQSWIFALETDWSRVLPSLITLVVLSLLSFLLLYRRVSAPIRI